MPGLKQAACLAGSDTGVPVLGLHSTRVPRKRSVKLQKPRLSMHPPPARHSTMWSSIIFTAVPTSRPTSWGCFRLMRRTRLDFVVGPLWRVRRRGHSARTARADPSPILIDGVNDERIQRNGSFPDHAGRALVPCFAIRGNEPTRAEHHGRHGARMWTRSISSSEVSSCSRLYRWVVRVDSCPAMRVATSRSPPFRSYSVISVPRNLCTQISGTTFRQMRQARRFPMASMTWIAHRSRLADQILPRRDSRLAIHLSNLGHSARIASRPISMATNGPCRGLR